MALPTEALREELDRLRVGDAEAPTLWERVAHRADEPLPATPELLKLDEGLAHAGVHTLADARLLGRLAQKDKRSRELASGMRRRTRKALVELELLVAAMGRGKRRTGQAKVSWLQTADDLVRRLERALAIERAMEAPETRQSDDAAPLYRPIRNRPPPKSAALAAIERYVDRAGAQAVDLRKKRRDLDRAHELLLALSAQLKPDDRARAMQLRARLADERQRLDAIEPLVRPGERLPDAITRALHQGQTGEAYRGLLAVFRGAMESRDTPLVKASRTALDELWRGLNESPDAAIARDAERVLADRLGEGALRELLDAQQRQARDVLLETAYELPQDTLSVFNLALSAGEFFDTTMVEEEVEEGDAAMASAPEPRQRVPFPTPLMDFDLATDITQLRNFVIRDPRLVLYDLANGSQLQRVYFEQNDRKPKKTRRSAVRVYICDASGSMRGPRARFRDAVLIAELNNLSLRARAGKEVWPIYYAFFNDQPQPLRRVDTPKLAYDLIADLFQQSPARGRTDITYAVVAAFEAIHEARGQDPDLARATVVLITDGEDQVDMQRISAARAPVGDVEVTFNFISLGDENADLRQLVWEQRDRGRRAFYTHLSDDDIAAGASPFEPALRTLLPEHPDFTLTPDSPQVRAALDALAAISAGTSLPSGPRASTRFGAYFPWPLPASTGRVPVSERDRVLDLLAAVSEALALAPAPERADEAVELIEHLLGLYNVPLERHRAVLGSGDAEIGKLVMRIRLLAGVMSDSPPVAEAQPA